MLAKIVKMVLCVGTTSTTNASRKNSTVGAFPAKQKDQTTKLSSLPWTEKYRPKTPNDIVGNQSLVCVLVIAFPDFL